MLWRSLVTSPGDVAELTSEVEDELSAAVRSSARLAVAPRTPKELTAEEVRAALDRANGVQERAWRDLGLANRYVLKRLIRKLGLSSSAPDDEPDA